MNFCHQFKKQNPCHYPSCLYFTHLVIHDNPGPQETCSLVREKGIYGNDYWEL